MTRITYNAFIALENDLFEPQIDLTNTVQQFPVVVYHTGVDRYNLDIKVNTDINQPDIRVNVTQILNTSRTTIVTANSAKVFASDIQFEGVYYYFKYPIPNGTNVVQIDGVVTTNKDSHFVYFTNNLEHDLTFDTTKVRITPYPVFICQNYVGLNSIISLDNKTYAISLVNGRMILTYNVPNLSIVTPNVSIFELDIINNLDRPLVQYDPFYVLHEVNGIVYTYDYSRITPVLAAGIYTYNNQFNLLPIDFDQTQYSYFDVFCGFGSNGNITTTIYDDIGLVINQVTDQTILFSRFAVEKNPVNVDYLFENLKPAMIIDKTIVGTRMAFDSTAYKYCQPIPIYLTQNGVDSSIKGFAPIPGQLTYKNLSSFLCIEGYRLNTTTFKFDISSYTNYIDISTGQLVTGYVLDYTTVTPITTYFNYFKSFIEARVNYPVNIDNFRLFGSIDGIAFTTIDESHYSGSINSSISELTIKFLDTAYTSYNYISIGFLMPGNLQFISTEVIKL